MPASSMGSRLLGDPASTSGYAVNRPNFPPLMSQDPDLPAYGNFNPAPRQVGHLGNSFPSQIPSYNPIMPGLPMDQGPRSSGMGGQDGPPFDDTKVIYPVITARNQQLTPKIDAKIQKGFFKVDHKWTCYRRNYFTVSCSFSLKPATYEPHFYLQRHANQQHEQINRFAMQISAKTAVVNNQESELRQLVQHTPKRDKATESIPGKVILQPAQPSILTNAGSFHGDTMYGAPPNIPHTMMVDYSPQQYSSPQHQGPPQSHTFERIQFQKATANNGKRRAQQQYFHVVVELFTDVSRHGEPQWVKIATSQSQPMVVRGRSPGHYKDNRRDSAASMDPDRGAGAGGDGSGGAPSMGAYLSPSQARSSTMDWESTHRGSSQMGGSYRHVAEVCSPKSGISVGSSSSSYGELGFDLLRNEPAMNTCNLLPSNNPMPTTVNGEAFAYLGDCRLQSGQGSSRAQPINKRSCFATNETNSLDSFCSTTHHPNRMDAMEARLHQTLCSS